MAVAGVALVAVMVVRWPSYSRASKEVAEVMTARHAIAANSTVLGLNYAPVGCDTNDPASQRLTDVHDLFTHIIDYLGTGTGHVVMLDNIGGLYPMFPYMWRGDRNPFSYIAGGQGFEGSPPAAGFARYNQVTGGSVDYVVTWCKKTAPANAPDAQAIDDQLAAHYDRTFASPNGKVEVYRYRALATPAPPRPRSAADDLAASYQAYHDHKWQESIDAAKRVLAANPKDDGAYTNMCAAYIELGQLDDAIAAGEKAIEINPDNQLGRNNLAWAATQEPTRIDADRALIARA